MDDLHNYKYHDLQKIKDDIKIKGYSTLSVEYVINFYKDSDLEKYFSSHNLKIEKRKNNYEFTILEDFQEK